MKNIFKDNEAMLLLVLYIILLLIACLGITSCKTVPPEKQVSDDAVYLEMSDGARIEVVADEYDRQFLKEPISKGVYIYIPLPVYEEEEQDTLKHYYIKL